MVYHYIADLIFPLSVHRQAALLHPLLHLLLPVLLLLQVLLFVLQEHIVLMVMFLTVLPVKISNVLVPQEVCLFALIKLPLIKELQIVLFLPVQVEVSVPQDLSLTVLFLKDLNV